MFCHLYNKFKDKISLYFNYFKQYMIISVIFK